MLDLILVNLFVGLAAFIQAAVGIGFAMIAVPLLALIDLAHVPTSSLLVMLVLSVYMLVSGWADIDRAGLSTLLPGLLIGTLIAAALLPLLDGQWFGVVFGFIVLFGVALSFLGNLPPPTPAQFGAGGLLAGLMGTMSGIHGPPLVLLYQQASPAQARATIALIFTIGTLLSLASLFGQGYATTEDLTRALPLLPGLLTGLALAVWSRNLMSRKLARTLMLSLAALSALSLIYKSLLGA